MDITPTIQKLVADVCHTAVQLSSQTFPLSLCDSNMIGHLTSELEGWCRCLDMLEAKCDEVLSVLSPLVSGIATGSKTKNGSLLKHGVSVIRGKLNCILCYLFKYAEHGLLCHISQRN